MPTNPFVYTDDRVRNEDGNFAADVAEVTRVPDANHLVQVRLVGEKKDTSPIGMPMAVKVHGDVAQPSEGDFVVVVYGKGDKPVAIATLYTQEDSIRDHEPEERIVGTPHGDAHVSLLDDTVSFGPRATVPKRDSDPSSPVDGEVWYRTDLGEYRGVESGTVVSFDTTAI